MVLALDRSASVKYKIGHRGFSIRVEIKVAQIRNKMKKSSFYLCWSSSCLMIGERRVTVCVECRLVKCHCVRGWGRPRCLIMLVNLECTGSVWLSVGAEPESWVTSPLLPAVLQFILSGNKLWILGVGHVKHWYIMSLKNWPRRNIFQQ